MDKQKRVSQVAIAVMLIPLLLLSGCGESNKPIVEEKLTETPTQTLTQTPTQAPTLMPTPLIPDEIKTDLEERFGEVEIIKKNGVSYVAAKDGRNVGFYAAESENWVVLPEDKPDWRVPTEAEIILDEDKNPVVFGANSRLWKYNEEDRWVTDLSKVDVWALTDWLEQVVENAQGPVEEMQFPPKHDAKGFYALNDYYGYVEKEEVFAYRVPGWFGAKVAVRESDSPDEAFILLAPVVHDKYGQPHRLMVLGFVQAGNQVFGTRLNGRGQEVGSNHDMVEPNLGQFNEYYSHLEKGQDVIVWMFYGSTYNKDSYDFFGLGGDQVKEIFQKIYNGNIPEDLPILPEITIFLNDKALKD